VKMLDPPEEEESEQHLQRKAEIATRHASTFAFKLLAALDEVNEVYNAITYSDTFYSRKFSSHGKDSCQASQNEGPTEASGGDKARLLTGGEKKEADARRQPLAGVEELTCEDMCLAPGHQ